MSDLDPQKRPTKNATFAEYLAYLYLHNLPLVLEVEVEGKTVWQHLGHPTKQNFLRYCEGHDIQKGPEGIKNPSVPAGEWSKIDPRKALQGQRSDFLSDPVTNRKRGRPEHWHQLTNRGWRLHLQTRTTPEAAHWRDHLNNVEAYQDDRHNDAVTRLDARDAVNEFRKLRATDEEGNVLSGYRQDILSAAQAGALHGVIRLAPKAVQHKIKREFGKTCKPESIKYTDYLHPTIVALKSIALRGLETALSNPRLFNVAHIDRQNAFGIASEMAATTVNGMASLIPPELMEPRMLGVGSVRIRCAWNDRGLTTIAKARKIIERRRATQLTLRGV